MKNLFFFNIERSNSFDSKKYYKFDKQQKAFIIDIKLDDYKDVFNYWDFSPWRKRDLDKELNNYLLDCLREIPLRQNLIIIFHLPGHCINMESEAQFLKGFKNFISYSIHRIRLHKRQHWYRTRIYIFLGLIFVAAAYFLVNLLPKVFPFSIIQEGLFIGGWVFLWEAFTNIFFKNYDLSKNNKLYRKLLNATIQFNYSPV